MSGMDEDSIRVMYELSKVTNTSKQIIDDFVLSVVLLIFKDYICYYKDPSTALDSFMSLWRDNVIRQKELEIDALVNNQDSMSDMVIGSKIANSKDIKKFIEEVDNVSDYITESILGALDE